MCGKGLAGEALPNPGMVPFHFHHVVTLPAPSRCAPASPSCLPTAVLEAHAGARRPVWRRRRLRLHLPADGRREAGRTGQLAGYCLLRLPLPRVSGWLGCCGWLAPGGFPLALSVLQQNAVNAKKSATHEASSCASAPACRLPPEVRRAAAAEMARVLKPGGICILTDSSQLGDREAFDATLG